MMNNPIVYKSAIGAIQYVTHTHLEIESIFVESHSIAAVKSVLKYLKETSKHGLCKPKSCDSRFEAVIAQSHH